MPRKSRLMPIPEAIAEARRWLAYLDAQAAKAKQLAELAADRRANKVDEREVGRRLNEIHRRMGLVVYDGALLAEAVKSLIANAEAASGNPEVDSMMTAFAEQRAANAKSLKEIEEKGG